MAPITLDLRGLRCPLPVLRTRKALRGLPAQAVLVVHCTDPLAGLDIPNLLRATGDNLVSTVREAETITFTILKRGPIGPPDEDRPAC